MSNNSQRRREAKRTARAATRRAIEVQFNIRLPDTSKPNVSLGWGRVPQINKAPVYNQVGHPRCYL